MRARVPQDVDLEDKLVYGLSPARLGYLVTSLLAALAVWSSDWAADAVRLAAALVTAAAGAALAWGRWRERPLDGWAGDALLYVGRNFALTYQPGWHRRPGDRQKAARPGSRGLAAQLSRQVIVSGSGPGEDATTVAVEVACLLAARGERTVLVDGGEAQLRLGLTSPGRHPTSGLELRSRAGGWQVDPGDRFRWQILVGVPQCPGEPQPAHLFVSRGRGGNVCRLVRDDSEFVVTIPDDPTVESAQAAREPAVMFDPAAPASRAAGVLADLLNAPR